MAGGAYAASSWCFVLIACVLAWMCVMVEGQPSSCSIGRSAAAPALSCADVYNACGGALLDDAYWLQPVGVAEPYLAVCADDGWTLALRLDGRLPTFRFSSSYWTDDALLNPDVTQLSNASEAKLAPFLSVPGNELRVRMLAPSNRLAGGDLRVSLPAFSSMRALFTGGFTPTSEPLSSWYGLVPGGTSHEFNCNLQGINIDNNVMFPGIFHQYRLGILFNNENDCNSIDISAGLGADIFFNYFTGGVFRPYATTGQFVESTWLSSDIWLPGTLHRGTAEMIAEVWVRGPAPTPTPSPTSTPTPSPTATASPVTACLSSFQRLAYTDVDGQVLAVLTGSSEDACRLSCCRSPSPCDAYVFGWDTGHCFLKGNSTLFGPGSFTHAGVLRPS